MQSSDHESGVSFTDFKFAIYKRYQHPPHLALIDKVLGEVTKFVETGGKEGLGRVIIQTPPRHGKTLTTSRYYPAWHLGRNPDHRMMLVSYGSSLAEKNSRAARNIIASPRYQTMFKNTKLAKDSKSANAWDIEGHEGGVDALGILGAATGKGAQILDIDDAIKNREEAESAVIRDKTWDAFTDDLYTRLEPGGAVIIQGTRWHEDDLQGRAQKYMPGEWYVLRLPAYAEENDPLERAIGEPLWEARYPLSRLRDIERTMGSYSWSALYQQRPVPAEGGIFKRAWFHRVSGTPEIVHTVRYWDLAMSSRETADYTVGVKIGQALDGHYYILDVTRFQLEWGDVVPKIAEIAIADGASVLIGVEEAGFMSRAIQELNQDHRLHGYAVFGYPVDKDKVTRALPFAARLSAGTVHVVDNYWTDDYLDEMCSFPNGAHDDQVDASSGAWAMIGSSMIDGAMSYASEDTFSGSY